MLKKIPGFITKLTKHEYSDTNPVIYAVTFPISIYYNLVMWIDNKLFQGRAHLIRYIDLFWVGLIAYLLWYRLTH